MLAFFSKADSATVQTQLYNETHGYWACIALINPAEVQVAWVTRHLRPCYQQTSSYHTLFH